MFPLFGIENMLKTILKSFFSEWLATLVILAAIYLTSLSSYLLFHSIAELFTICIIMSIFVVTWNTRHQMDNSFLLIMGVAFFFVGILDTLHLLAFKGMGIIQWNEPTNLPTQLWIAMRYLLSLSFLAAPLLINRKPNLYVILVLYGLVTSLILLSIFYWRIFPQSYIEGSGLTLFKRISEYIIAFIFLLSIVVLFRVRSRFEPRIFNYLVVGLMFMMVAEITFADYVNVYGISNLIGHLFIVVSFVLVYKAILETGLKMPFSLLFRNLKTSQERLEKRSLELSSLNAQLTVEIDERKKVEQSLLESEKNLEKMIGERTSQLQESYRNLEAEVRERKRAENELRTLTNRTIELQEDERQSIAQELHDEVGQLLTALNLLLTLIKKSVDQNMPGSPVLKDIEESRQVVKDLLERIRTLSVNLHPSMLENVGLIPTLDWYHKEYTRRTGIVVHFSQVGEESGIAARIKLTAYRIFQEALTNIARHADVKEAWVQIKFNTDAIEMIIEDQGKGFNMSEFRASSAGIKGMGERAMSVGGRTELISSPDAGTRVEVFLPKEFTEV